eukprot:TRINITY_DN8412_c0_g1_i5.p2 TRINITY_DN8412_c0_g1~~TRINITY_DN8412_c0_g1_i5.p2  ORF type:complete len:163 (-),score=15.36 TRINITY_DN8412_c0_g1_i5:1074-1562(-)
MCIRDSPLRDSWYHGSSLVIKMELLSVTQKGWLDVKRIRTGSLYLCTGALGAGIVDVSVGVLTLPFVMKQSGIILGLVMIILGYSAMYWSFQLIIEVDNKTGGNSTMRELYSSAGGKRLANFYDITCIFTFSCLLLSNQIISTFRIIPSCQNGSIYSNKLWI